MMLVDKTGIGALRNQTGPSTPIAETARRASIAKALPARNKGETPRHVRKGSRRTGKEFLRRRPRRRLRGAASTAAAASAPHSRSTRGHLQCFRCFPGGASPCRVEFAAERRRCRQSTFNPHLIFLKSQRNRARLRSLQSVWRDQ
jgi:hypothetical protein